jgi:LemA protein
MIFGGDSNAFSAPVLAVKFFACGFVIIIASIYFKMKFLKTENIIFDIESQPLLETNEATDGVLFSGEGVVETDGDKVLRSIYTKTKCVYFHSIREKYVSRGKNSKWEIVQDLALFIPFYIADGRGKLKVDLKGVDYDFSNYKIPLSHPSVACSWNSEIDCETILEKQVYTEESKTFPFFPKLKSRKYRQSEYVLRPGTKVFAHGIVSREDGELVLREGEKYSLIISRKSRDQYVEEFYKGKSLVYLANFLIAIGYTAVLFSANYFYHLDSILLSTLLLIGNGVIMGSIVFSLYNRIITLQQRALNASSNIKIELKRRANLIPNLVKIVKEYSKYEKETQQIIAEARAEMVFSKELKKETGLVVPSLMAVIESYPTLKASENFQALMRALVDTEERIAHSREFYNRSVRKYNTIIGQFPFLIISLPFGMKEMSFISIARGEGVVPKVSISGGKTD